MKHLAVLIAAGLVAVAIYAVAAPAGEQAVTPKQFAALSKKVKNLQSELRAVENCALAKAVPVSRFGIPNSNEGYVYNKPDNTLVLETALDIDPSSNPQYWVLVTSSDCASIINSGKKHPVASFGAHHTK